LWNYPKYSLPRKEGSRYYFWKNDGLQNQPVLYLQPSLTALTRPVLDPNQWSPDGTVAVSGEFYSHDGKLLAYAVSRSGSDWQEIRVREVDTDRDLPDTLRFCRFTHIGWKHDASGFFYSRFPDPATVPEEDRNNFNRVFWHQLGTEQSADRLIYERPDQKEWGFAPMVSDDGQYLLLHVYHGTDPRNRLYYREVQSEGPFIKLLDDFDASYE
jgi:prolyl oligopeptidase